MPTPPRSMLRLTAIGLFVLTSASALAEPQTFTLTLRDQAFQPTQLTVPAGQKIKLEINNADAIPAEFESYDLNREKVISGHGSATLYVGPLAAGSYEFFNDFNQKATGTIVAE